ILARSLHHRYAEALGEKRGEIPEGLYPGEYLIAVGEALAARDGRKWLGKPEGEWLEPLRAFAVEKMLALIKEDLEALGVTFALFTHERALVESGGVDEALASLEAKGLIY